MSNKIKKIDKRSIAVVTTFSQKGYIAHGHKMIQTFDRKWPKNVDLYVYYENKKPNIKSKRIHYINIEDACTELVDFKKKWDNDPRAHGRKSEKRFGYKWMAIKFSHKVYCVAHAAKSIPHDILVWLDADTVSKGWVSNKFIHSLIPKKFYCSYLGRGKRHSECGFMAFNIKHKANANFMNKYQWFYDSGEIFDLEQWNDCYVFDRVRKKMQKRSEIKALDLTPDIRYDNFNIIMDGKMIHLKGSVKSYSKSQENKIIKKMKKYTFKNNISRGYKKNQGKG